MIGILGAFSLNSWNDNRKNINVTERFLESFKEDLINDTIVFSSALERIERNNNNRDIALKRSFNNASLRDLENAAVNRTTYINYLGRDLTFTKMNNQDFHMSGKYEVLFDAINEYYLSKSKLSETIGWDHSATLDEWIEIEGEMTFEYRSRYNNWTTDSLKWVEERRKKIIDFVSRTFVRNKYIIDMSRKERIARRYENQKAMAIELIEKINNR